MNLPQLTAKIGQAAKSEIDNPSELAMLVETINVEPEKGYLLFMTMDLENQEIRFENPVPFNQEHTFQYHYFGNNSAAGMQYYLTRDGSSVHYLLKSVFSDLYLVLHKHGLQNGELSSLLAEMNEQKLINLGSKQGTGTISLDKIKGCSGGVLDSKNNVVVNGVAKKADEFIRHLLQWENKDSTFALIIPRIIRGGDEPIILPQHPDYVAVTKKHQKIETSSGRRKKEKFCYVCHQRSTDVSSELTTNFSRSGINKTFVTTTLNYAKSISKKYYDDSYALCSGCYQDLLLGEKRVSQNFSKPIANEDAFILPDGLLDDFDYNRLVALKQGVDLFFEKGLAQEVEEELGTVAEEFHRSQGYVVHFFVYRSGGKSIEVLKTISDVPTMQILRITKSLGRQVERLHPYIRFFSLGSIYRMIPVRTKVDKKTKKKVQIDIQRVLSVYQSLFTNTPIETNVLFGYAAEALEKGFKEIRKKKRSQYTNLGLDSFMSDQEDRFFRQLTMRYVCFLQTCQEMELLDRKIFHKKGVIKMNTIGMTSEVQEIENFLEEQGFDAVPRALFYLGAMLRSVASAQYDKDHKSKPVLNKIAFQGMNQNEVVRLYQDVLEKLNQYSKWTMKNEQYMKAFNYYFGPLDEEKALTEQEHVFYVMAGYSFYPAKLKDVNSEGSPISSNEQEQEAVPQ